MQPISPGTDSESVVGFCPEAAIRVANLGKRYRIGETHSGVRTIKGSVGSRIQQLLRHSSPDSEDDRRTLWALRHCSFELAAGESLGIVGSNGSGKSTLLQILARAVSPTEGVAEVRGRVAPLIAMGAGFNPEFTGRENILVSGVMLGLSLGDIHRRLDQIIEFAGIDRFLDTPVKRYSSGMYVRLAFSVVAHLDADVILADEVLAVGDLEFQNKCMDRMTRLVGEGKTLLFVSHNQSAMARLCPRSLYLSAGIVVADGPTPEILERYNADVVGRQSNLNPA